MRIVCISDTHNATPELPEGDLLIHAGDLTMRGLLEEVESAFDWLNKQPFEKIVVIAGNHDFFFQHATPSLLQTNFLPKYPNITYLEDSPTTFHGKKIYGSPWTPFFYNWAFNFSNRDVYGKEAKACWSQIPHDTDILVTHGPALGTLDRVPRENTGCQYLRDRIRALPNLKLHVHGHIHCAHGREDANYITVNAAVMNEKYKPTQSPIVVEL